MKRCSICDTIYDEQGPDVCPEDGGTLKLDVVDDNFLGRVLSGRFKIEDLIGAGGMGRVYRARQLSVDRLVAVKILHREALLKKTATQRFLLEAKATSKVTLSPIGTSGLPLRVELPGQMQASPFEYHHRTAVQLAAPAPPPPP